MTKRVKQLLESKERNGSHYSNKEGDCVDAALIMTVWIHK